jgi:hypothetical protein
VIFLLCQVLYIYNNKNLVDQIIDFCYNIDTMKRRTSTRKRRNDCNHAVYVITNTVTQEQYVGITVASGNVRQALKIRMQKHLRRALTEGRDWTLCCSLREHGAEAHTYGVLEIVRGRLAAHARERELIRIHNPTLNTF